MCIPHVHQLSPTTNGIPPRTSVRSATILIAALRSTVALWRARSRQRQDLLKMVQANNGHLLRDIGVTREEALREADKWFCRR
jgi:uncharacterized protein YjiS (DUF1127 family)